MHRPRKFVGNEENTHEAQSTEHAVSAGDGSKPITHRRGSGYDGRECGYQGTIKKEDTVEWKPDDGPKVLCEENDTTYYLGVGDIDGEESYLFGPRSSCELSSDEDICRFAFSAQVFTRDGNNYIPVNAEKRVELEQKYSFVLEIPSEGKLYRLLLPRRREWSLQIYNKVAR